MQVHVFLWLQAPTVFHTTVYTTNNVVYTTNNIVYTVMFLFTLAFFLDPIINMEVVPVRVTLKLHYYSHCTVVCLQQRIVHALEYSPNKRAGINW